MADEPRVYAGYQVDDPGWRLADGTYGVRVATSASPDDVAHQGTIHLAECRLD